MTALYNEIDNYAARWIGNLIDADHVAPGVVDTRSIVELQPEDVQHVTQAHFFAGIAVWSAALRAAGWPDDVSIWTGSCPCQPFSQAGQGKGTEDERHLWPEWFRLIRQCRPPVIVGEQVASPAGLGWLDAVFADLEGAGYACAAIDLCAAGVGAPHLRQRLYFVAVADGERLEGVRLQLRERRSQQAVSEAGRSSEADRMGDPRGAGGRWNAGAVPSAQGEGAGERSAVGDLADVSVTTGTNGELADSDNTRLEIQCEQSTRNQLATAERGVSAGTLADTEEERRGSGRIGEPHGRSSLESERHCDDNFWTSCDWLHCTDGKTRPVEPGTFPLAHGAPARVGRLRAYGNAIVKPQAQAFLETVIDILTE